jgi:hypothetical protein
MASMTTTTNAGFIPQVWAKEAQIARESRLVMANSVERHDMDVVDKGNVINIPKVSNLSASDIGNDGSLTDSANTEGLVTITINKWKGVSFNVPDILASQAAYDLMKLYAEKVGYALGLVVEQNLLALYSSLSGTYQTGAAATDLTDAVLRLSIEKLDNNRVPMDDRHLVVLPHSRNVFLGIDKFVRYDSMPWPAGENPIYKGNIGQLYGVEVLITPEVTVASSTAQNLMFHRSAFGLALQRDIQIEKFARTQFADRIGGSELYGMAVLRDDHAVQVQS